MALGLLKVPADWLFRDYTDPNIVAWNWSFLPLDLLASVTGLSGASNLFLVAWPLAMLVFSRKHYLVPASA
ncbi:MAG: DUF5360 family protein [Polyangiaceae bacterium]|nr:DUF5360 family protein [Polyangiaceae bacterium]